MHIITVKIKYGILFMVHEISKSTKYIYIYIYIYIYKYTRF